MKHILNPSHTNQRAHKEKYGLQFKILLLFVLNQVITARAEMRIQVLSKISPTR
jgi:hypothetical protein